MPLYDDGFDMYKHLDEAKITTLRDQRDRAVALLRELAPIATTVASWWLSDGDPNETSAVKAANKVEAMADEIETFLAEVDKP